MTFSGSSNEGNLFLRMIIFRVLEDCREKNMYLIVLARKWSFLCFMLNFSFWKYKHLIKKNHKHYSRYSTPVTHHRTIFLWLLISCFVLFVKSFLCDFQRCWCLCRTGEMVRRFQLKSLRLNQVQFERNFFSPWKTQTSITAEKLCHLQKILKRQRSQEKELVASLLVKQN